MTPRFLLIVSDFYHGGAQRQTYELDRVLNERGIKSEILCVTSLNQSKHFPDHFYALHKELGTPITFLQELREEKSVEKRSLAEKIKGRLSGNASEDRSTSRLNNFLKSFRRVHFMGEYTHRSFEKDIDHSLWKEEIIFIMNARFQGEKYRALEPNRKYVFVSAFVDKEEIKYEFEKFPDYRHVTLLHSVWISPKHRQWKFDDTRKKKIGIFTRLSRAKPLDPFFYAFHLLLDKLPDVELHIYGTGTAKEVEYDRYPSNLGIEDKVFFRGHQEDIKATINIDQLDLIWFQGYGNKPAGYAAVDAALTGTPQLFWEFSSAKHVGLNDTSQTHPHFKNLNRFVDASLSVLTNSNIASELSEKQYLDVFNNHNMSTNFSSIESLFTA